MQKTVILYRCFKRIFCQKNGFYRIPFEQ